jgi:PKHD-type hydroxylase
MYFFEKPQNFYNFFYFYQNLDNNEILNISKIVSNYSYSSATTNNSALDTLKSNPRISQIKWIPFNNSTEELYTRLSQLIEDANKEFFNFDIFNSLEDLQYTEYNELDKGKYDWHIDTHLPTQPPYRKLSLTIQLSDPSEYEGGDLEISIPQPEKNIILKVPKEKGKVIVFPSYLWHRVTPVTKGVRKSLVWWVGGAPFR